MNIINIWRTHRGSHIRFVLLKYCLYSSRLICERHKGNFLFSTIVLIMNAIPTYKPEKIYKKHDLINIQATSLLNKVLGLRFPRVFFIYLSFYSFLYILYDSRVRSFAKKIRTKLRIGTLELLTHTNIGKYGLRFQSYHYLI